MIDPFLLHNDDVLPGTDTCLMPGQVGVLAGWGVFSTLRVADGVLFEYPRHFARMQRDARLLGIPFPQDPEWIESRLLRLLQANGVSDAALRVIVVRNKGGVWQ